MHVEPEMIVGFDLDGVIIDHTVNKIRIAARYGIALKPEDTPTERMWRIIPESLHKEIRMQMYDDTDEALSAPLMPGAFDGLARLKERAVPYVLISRRKFPIPALHLIERRGLWGNYFTPENTFFVERPEDKDPVARKIGVTHFVDDERHVLAAMPSVPTKILFDQRNVFPGEADFRRVTNWFELGRILGIATS